MALNAEALRAYKRQHYLSNKARYRENNKRWVAANSLAANKMKRKWSRENLDREKEMKRISARNHYAANAEKRREKARRWRRENSEKRRLSIAKWREVNPTKIRAHKANRRSRIAAATGSLTAIDIQEIVARQKGKCAACAEKVKLDMDHIMPLALGGSGQASNFQGLCRSCNCRKHARHPIDFNRSLGLLL